ncbi:MAG: ankyrin repeat domain-containing protein [Acidobacteria bacterium]|nr:ankyrin repeat domain-containing protein [Acidobacteriota bacterium]
MRCCLLAGLAVAATACRKAPTTPLTHAAATADAAEVRRLLSEGADPNETIDDWTPLAWAARLGNEATIHALLEAGAKPSLPSGRNQWSPLQMAIHVHRLDSVRAVLPSASMSEKLRGR